MTSAQPTQSSPSEIDVVVVGGGAAGLAGAKALARSRRRVVVIDAGEPRNAPADGVHNYLGAEGLSPLELTARGREELAAYGGEAREGRAVAARPLADPDAAAGEGPGRIGFEVELADGQTVRCRRLLVATGLVDGLPDVPGLAERWGRDVLHCPFCHGWEVRDQRIVVHATEPFAGVHQALLFRALSPEVTVLLDGITLDAEQRADLDAWQVAVHGGAPAGLEVADDRLVAVRLQDGGSLPADALVVRPRFAATSPVLDSLGLHAEVGEQATAYPAGQGGATSVPGVSVAGNVTDPMAQVLNAAAAGLQAGAMLHAGLIQEDTALLRSERAGRL